MSSIDSLPSSPASPQAELNEAALREGLELAEGIRRLGRMVGVKSLHRNLRDEDAQAQRNTDAAERALFGQDVAPAFKSDQAQDRDEMELMAARDIHLHYDGSQNKPAQASNAASKLGKAALLGAALLGTGGLSAVLGAYLTQPSNQAVEPSATVFDPTKWQLEVSEREPGAADATE